MKGKKNNGYEIPHCSECEFMKTYDHGRKMYYCDHEDRIDDMGKLSADIPPGTCPGWCPLRDRAGR